MTNLGFCFSDLGGLAQLDLVDRCGRGTAHRQLQDLLLARLHAERLQGGCLVQ